MWLNKFQLTNRNSGTVSMWLNTFDLTNRNSDTYVAKHIPPY